MTGRRVLVTGAQGLLGRHVVAHVLTQEPTARVLGVGRSSRQDAHYTHDLAWRGFRLAAPLPEWLRRAGTDARYAYAALDLRERDALARLLRRFAPDVIVHSAAALRDEPWPALLASNVESIGALVESVAAAGRAPHTRIVAASSGSVYGATPTSALPLSEDFACQPLDLYAASKRAAEDIGRILAEAHGVWLAHGRVFNLLGPGLQDRHLCGALAGQLAAVAGGASPPLVSVGPLDTTRDFIDVRDAAAALLTMADRARPGETWNVASGIETAVQDVFDALVELSGLTGAVTVERRAGRPADIARSVADVSRLRAAGHTPRYDIHSSLADMLAYYRDLVVPAALS